jgi:hypothetical protein
MMMKPSTHKNYTAADIQRYHSGMLSVEEMNEMEKSALEDTMLSDAIDGYEHQKNIDSDLVTLREKINNRNSKKSATNIRKLYTSLSIAASVMAIFSVAYFLINKNENKQQQLSSNNTNPTQNISPVLQETSTTENLANIDSPSTIAKKDNISIESKAQHPNEISDNFSEKEAQELASILKSDKQSATSKIVEKTDLQPNAKALASVSNIPNATAFSTQQQLVSTKGTEDIAKADDTKFEFDSKKETNADLTATSDNIISSDSINSFAIVKNNNVNAVAVSKAKVGIPAAANMSINNDLQMQEVVVTGYNNTRKKTLEASVQKVSAKDLKKTENKPDVDKNVFLEHVTIHKKPCIDNAGNEIHGTVSLKFNINKNGRPEKIKVNQSLNTACDNQAIQLLSDGPNWNNSRNKKAVVQITF